MNEDYVTASEIGDWVYCRRSWWYTRRRESTLASPLLDRGTAAHEVVTEQVLGTERLHAVAVWLIVVSATCLLLIGLLLLGSL